jgi:hypothetical protein
MIDMSVTIAPKSDQLNADDLVAGPKTILITGVRLTGDEQQPVAIDFHGCNGRPYKPGKSMRRVLVYLWGANAGVYVGRTIVIYCDPAVSFGGSAVGGIRISAMSNIDKDSVVLLTAKRAVRKPFYVKMLVVSEDVKLDNILRMVSEASSEEELRSVSSMAAGLSLSDRALAKKAFSERRSNFTAK